MPSITSTEQIKIFREDHVSIAVYRNRKDNEVYYDIVPSRLVYLRQPDGTKKRKWSRSANYKPCDLPKLIRLATQVIELLDNMGVIEQIRSDQLELRMLV